MANHGFLIFKSNIKLNEISKILQEINENRFKNKLIITFHEGDQSWFIEYQSPTRLGCPGFRIWKRSPRKLEFRHPYGKWMPYVMTVFIETLSFKMNSIISDEGTNNKWIGDPNNYCSFKQWSGDFYPKNCDYISIVDKIFSINSFIESDLEDAPEELRDC